MELVNVLVAALGAWLFGAAWYMALSKPWIAAAGIECGEAGRPVNGNDPKPFILSAVAMIVVAGMMRHMFALSGIDTVGKGIVAGLGVGLFFIAPWVMINNAYAGRTFRLTLIDGGYAVFGSTIIGAILTLF